MNYGRFNTLGLSSADNAWKPVLMILIVMFELLWWSRAGDDRWCGGGFADWFLVVDGSPTACGGRRRRDGHPPWLMDLPLTAKNVPIWQSLNYHLPDWKESKREHLFEDSRLFIFIYFFCQIFEKCFRKMICWGGGGVRMGVRGGWGREGWGGWHYWVLWDFFTRNFIWRVTEDTRQTDEEEDEEDDDFFFETVTRSVSEILKSWACQFHSYQLALVILSETLL